MSRTRSLDDDDDAPTPRRSPQGAPAKDHPSGLRIREITATKRITAQLKNYHPATVELTARAEVVEGADPTEAARALTAYVANIVDQDVVALVEAGWSYDKPAK